MYLKDYERKRLLERGEMASISEESDNEGNIRNNISMEKMAYNKEQKDIKER